ncbi:MAG TPA: choice-of-anchor tandem repeat NxxGxxAF-containing protein [Phycisphaerales bacterium]|nr:choice-of-anchor tandem repeat NxxGxxAF-containing protein [Phycisphaerales bacterium]
MNPRSVAAGVLVCMGVPAFAQPASPVFTKVVVTGDVLDALGPDYTFQGYNADPSVDADGAVIFNGRFDGPDVFGDNNGGIFHGSAGALSLVLRAQSQAPGLPEGVLYNSPQFITARSAGVVIFNALLTGDVDGSNDLAVFQGAVPSLRPIARTSWDVPGTQGQYRLLRHRPVLNASGRFAIVGDLNPYHDHRAVLSGSGDSLELVAETGQQAPGFAPGETYRGGIRSPVLADTGRLAFFAATSDGFGVLAGQPGAVSAIVRYLDPAPGIDGGVFTTLGSPSISPAGRIAFEATVEIGGESAPTVWRETADGAGIEPVVGLDTVLPGMGDQDRIRSVWRVSIDDAGAVAFGAQLHLGGDITPNNDSGLWVFSDGSYETIMREGEQYASFPAGVRPAFFNGNRYSGLNARRQMVCDVFLQGDGVDESNDTALVGWDPDAGVVMLLREGDAFDVGDGDPRVVQSIDFTNSFYSGNSYQGQSGTGGSATGLNDGGVVAVGIRFADGTSGIFTTVLGPCRPDLTGDGTLDTRDVLAFLNAWAQDDALADWNGDGAVDTRDCIAYLNEWAAGC